MRVIHELVAYFDRRGRLDPDCTQRLLDQGLLAHDAPQTMVEHVDTPGRTWYFRVTGETEGRVWGTDVYSGDSSVATAAVHAGIAKPGETVVVRVVAVAPPDQFSGSLRYGVTTHDFTHFGSAFRFEPMTAG